MLRFFTVRRKLILLFFLPSIVLFFSYSPHSFSVSTMSPPPSTSSVASALLASKGFHLQNFRVLQSLWAGYGHICHITASPNTLLNSSAETSRTASTASSNMSTPLETQTFILKIISPPPAEKSDEGHVRKILSYQVEQYFYSELAPLLPASIPVAMCLASINEHHPDGTFITAMILSDLQQQYPIAGEKREVLAPAQVHAAVDWLSGFHGFWWPQIKKMDRSSLVRPPLEQAKRDTEHTTQKTVWLNGGYTYLATRRTEYQSLAKDYDSEWNAPLTGWEEGDVSISEMIASILSPKEQGWGPAEEYQTLMVRYQGRSRGYA